MHAHVSFYGYALLPPVEKVETHQRCENHHKKAEAGFSFLGVTNKRQKKQGRTGSKICENVESTCRPGMCGMIHCRSEENQERKYCFWSGTIFCAPHKEEQGASEKKGTHSSPFSVTTRTRHFSFWREYFFVCSLQMFQSLYKNTSLTSGVTVTVRGPVWK